MRRKEIFYNVNTYSKDKRKPIKELYDSFFKLKKTKWIKKIIDVQKERINGLKARLPILGFRTKKKGKALWIIAGIHGEEPAGPNAISRNIVFLNKLAEKIPIVLLPLCNPIGYVKNWRYPYSKKYIKNEINKSVGDSEHLLLNSETLGPRRKKAICREADGITRFILKTFKKYPPLLVLDFHEDVSKSPAYIYSHGILDNQDTIAIEIVKILKKGGFRIQDSGKTIFNQNITNGVVSNIKDGSIDEFLASDKIIVNNKIIKGPSAKSVVVIETNTNVSIEKRIGVQSHILKHSKNFLIQLKNKKSGYRKQEIV